MMNDWGHNGGWWNGGMIVMGVFWLLLIGLGVWAVWHLARRSGITNVAAPAPGWSPESARQILDRRFAAGEIDAPTYAEHRRILEGRSADSATVPPGPAGGGVDTSKAH